MTPLLPATLRCEAKLTTGAGVQVARRELEALAARDAAEAGVLAVLFLGGDRQVEGRWWLVDAERLRVPHGDTLSMTRSKVVAAARAPGPLDGLRRHVDDGWPAFLQAFRDEALTGHGPLVAELARCHGERGIGARLPVDGVLEAEHRAALQQLVRAHGEAGAGRIAQDLLAYLLASAGYEVTNNPVGVPDFVLSRPRDGRARSGAGGGAERMALELTPAEIERLVALCERAGEHALAASIARQGARVAPAPRRVA